MELLVFLCASRLLVTFRRFKINYELYGLMLIQVYNVSVEQLCHKNTKTLNGGMKKRKKKRTKTEWHSGRKWRSMLPSTMVGQSKIVFLFRSTDWKSLIFRFASLILANQPKTQLEFQQQNVCFHRITQAHLVFVWLPLDNVVLCYSSRVDQIKLKHTTAYNLFKSD